eukprot:TRINITY_DN12831_c0_g1_i3.p1 TRINITY_DN12831_c0_g1~~TRINITY_DN12831_c0_g1_i3.p1  ORF type:complete len:180 (-),score=51.45 TRINITY_DN12831_c0_g1_i3:34-513(-)
MCIRDSINAEYMGTPKRTIQVMQTEEMFNAKQVAIEEKGDHDETLIMGGLIGIEFVEVLVNDERMYSQESYRKMREELNRIIAAKEMPLNLRIVLLEGLRDSIKRAKDEATVVGTALHERINLVTKMNQLVNLVARTRGGDSLKTVSYTHLTLPTIYSV